MSKQIIACVLSVSFSMAGLAQIHSKFIIVNQFGYLQGAKKIAVIKDPCIGFDAANSFEPCDLYSLIRAETGERIFSGEISTWNSGKTDASSGDRTGLTSTPDCSGLVFTKCPLKKMIRQAGIN